MKRKIFLLLVMGVFLATTLFGCSCSKKEEFTVTFDSNGGSSVTSQTVLKDDLVTKPTDPTKEGYIFDNWLLNDEPYDFSRPVTQNITLKASWIEETSAISYKVSFKIDDSVNIISVIEGKTVTKPTNPIKEGYNFIGWYNGDELFDFKTSIYSDITLVAKWEKIEQTSEATKYTVKFDSNGGSSVASQTVKEGNTVSKPTNPTRSGYKFVSWQLNGKDYNFSSKVTKNITLTAKWEKVEQPSEITKYTVKFDSNGGSSVASQTVKEGNTVSKPANPTRSGYKFVSWQLNGKDYNFSSKVTKNITLTAKWEKIPDTYTIKFEKYDAYSPFGIIKVYQNGKVISFSELLDKDEKTVAKYNSSVNGINNANESMLNKTVKVKLTDGKIVNISK